MAAPVNSNFYLQQQASVVEERASKRLKYTFPVWDDQKKSTLSSTFLSCVEKVSCLFEQKQWAKGFGPYMLPYQFARYRIFSQNFNKELLLLKGFDTTLCSFGSQGLVFRVPSENHKDQTILKVSRWSHHTYDLCKEVLIIKEIYSQVLHRTKIPIPQPIFDVRTGSQYFFLMKAYKGNALTYLRDRGRFNIELVRKAAQDMLAALLLLHDNPNGGIIHCDIKPENILYEHDEEAKFPDFVLADFGLSLLLEKGHAETETRHTIVTRYYRAPEILFKGRRNCYTVAPSIDIWSLACVLYEFYTGRILFRSDSEVHAQTLIYPIFNGDPEENIYFKMECDGVNIPDRQLCRLLAKMLNFLPSKRPSAKEVLQDDFFKA